MMETKMNTGNLLKQALEKREAGKLPSNFTFRMMERIHKEAEIRHKRREKLGFAAIIAGVLVLIGLAVYVLKFRLDFRLRDYTPKWEIIASDSPIIVFYCYIAFLVLVLLGMDYWMRKHKRRSA